MNEKDLVGHTRRQQRKPVTAAQLDALRAYAQQHGRQWKQHLRDDWFSGHTFGLLQQLRNTHGPSWLVSFKLPALPADSYDPRRCWMSCPDCEQSFPVAATVPAHTWLRQPCAGSNKAGVR